MESLAVLFDQRKRLHNFLFMGILSTLVRKDVYQSIFLQSSFRQLNYQKVMVFV